MSDPARELPPAPADAPALEASGRRPHRRTATDPPPVQTACRRVLAALEGLAPASQLRVLRAAALLLGDTDDAPAA